MKPFAIDPSMIATLGGGFYPTGYSLIMFPDEQAARAVADKLAGDGGSGDDVYFLPSDAILSQISPTASESDDPLPSAGTEGATVRAYTKLAREGHVGLLVKTPDEDAADRLMQAVRAGEYSMAQRYRALVIEDL